MNDIVERLRDDRYFGFDMRCEAAAEIERLRAALKPFARKADAVSLSEALGHIEREHLRQARRVLEGK
jgi:hypothetical protein